MDNLYQRIRSGEFSQPKKEETSLYDRIRAGEFDEKPETIDTTVIEPSSPGLGSKVLQGIKSVDETMQNIIKAGMVGATFKPEERAEAMFREGVSPEAVDSTLTKIGYTGGDIARNLSQYAWAGQILGPLGGLISKIPGADKVPSVAKAAGSGVAKALAKKGVVEPLMSGEAPKAKDLAAESIFFGTMGGTGEALRNVMPEIPTMIGRPVKTGLSALAGSLAAAPVTEEKETFGSMAINAGIMVLFDAAGLALNPLERAMAEGERKTALINKKVLKPLSQFSNTLHKQMETISKGDPSSAVNNLNQTREHAVNYIEHLAKKNKWSPEFEQYAKNVVNSSVNSTITAFNQQMANQTAIPEQKAGPPVKVQPQQQEIPTAPVTEMLPAAKIPTQASVSAPETPIDTVKVQTPSVPLENVVEAKIETRDNIKPETKKGIEEKGEPLTVYHATDEEFEAFDFNKLGEYTRRNTNEKEAAVMAELGVWSNTQPLASKTAQKKDMKLNLSINNPLEITFDELWEMSSQHESGEELRNKLIEQGYDGLKVDDTEFGGTSYVAFAPEQIKVIQNEKKRTPETTFPTEKVISSYSHLHLSPSNTAKVEEKTFNDTVQNLETEIKKHLPDIDESKLKKVISQFKSDYLTNREKVWNVASSAYSSAVAGGSNFNAKQADKRGAALDNAEKQFSKWLNAEKERIEAELGIKEIKEKQAKEAAESKVNAKAEAEKKLIKKWIDIKPGDKVDIGGNAPVTVAKKNKKSIVTDSGAKWTISEVTGIHDNSKIESLLEQVEKESLTTGKDQTKESTKAKANTVLVNTLRSQAKNLDKQIEAKKNPAVASQNVTPRRASIAASMYAEGERLEQQQQILYKLADLHESGEMPESLSKINARTQIEQLEQIASYTVGRAYQAKAETNFKADYDDTKHSPYVSYEGYIHPEHLKDLLKKTKGNRNTAEAVRLVERIIKKEGKFSSDAEVKAIETLNRMTDDLGKWVKEGITEFKRLKKIGINNTQQLRQVLKDYSQLRGTKQEPDAIKKIRDMETALLGTKIPGYFPTPKPIVNDMIAKADIKPGMKVLEPSAGKGNIADEVPKEADLDVIELNTALRDILQEKGYKITGSDFLEHKGEYDRIVMNPPFEKGQDIEHVRHAYDLLKPGGKLVAIMSEGPFFRQDAKATEFREWLDEVGGMSEQLPEKSFTGAQADRQTGVNARMVEIEKPTAPRELEEELYYDKRVPETVEENISRGHQAMQTVIKTHKDVINAMYRPDLGGITFYWGEPGKGNKFKGGYGVSHIIAKRTAEGEDGQAVVKKMVEVIANGDVAKTQEAPKGSRAIIEHDGHTAVLSLYKDEDLQTWLLTGWKNKEVSNEIGEVYDSTDSTTSMPTRFQHEGAETSDTSIVLPKRKNVKSGPKGTTRHADTGGYAERDTPKQRESKAIELPELVQLAKDINAGKYPHVREKMGERRGVFAAKGRRGTITLSADIFKDPAGAAKTLAHEIGHLVDWLPDKTMARGNILGRIASLKKFMKHMIEEIPAQTTLSGPDGAQRPGAAASKQSGTVKGGLVLHSGGSKKKKGFITRDEIMNELKTVSMEWKPFDPKADPKFTKYRFSSAELYADALSVLLNEPELLKEKAPIFYKAFMDYLERKPIVKKIYDEIQERLLNNEAVIEKRLDDIEQMFVRDAEIRKKLDEERHILEPVIDTVIRGLVDRDYALLKKAGKLSKMHAEKGEKVKQQLEESRYIDGEIDSYLYEVEKRVISEINKAGLSASDVGTYLFLKRVLSDRSELANPLGHTPETAQKTLDGLKKRLGEDKYNKLSDIANEFREIREEFIIPRIEEAGMYSDELLELIKETKDYVKFNVLNYMEAKHGRNETARVYKQIGTLSEISNPLVSTALQDIAMLRAAKLNEVKKATVDMLRSIGEIELAETYYSLDTKRLKAKEPSDRNKTLFSVMENGEIKSYYINKEISKTFEERPYEATTIMKAWSLLNRPLRDLFVSKNPFWMTRNVIRDFNATVKGLPQLKLRDTGLLLKKYKEAFKEAWAEVVKEERSEDIKEMMGGWMLAPDRAYSSIDIGILEKIEWIANEFSLNVEDNKKTNVAKARLKRIYEYLDKIGRVTELTGKLSGYKYLKETTDLTKQEMGHLVRTRVGTPDYRRQGALHAITNNIFMFSNINKEGLRSAYESYSESKSTYIWKTIMLDILPKLLLYGMAIAGPPALKKIIDGISEYDKRSYTIVPLGLDENEKSVYLRIPQDYNSQIWGAITWDLLNGKITGQGGLLDEIGQVSPYQLHPLITTASELYQYYVKDINPQDDYRGRNILPPTTYQARGKEASKEMLKHTWKSLGGSLIYNPGGPLEYADTTFEKLLQYPPLNLLGTFLKVSDYGHKEKGIEEQRIEQRNKARSRLIKKRMDEALKNRDTKKYYELRDKLLKLKP